MTADLAVGWANRITRGSGKEAYQARRFNVARIFARHLEPIDPANEVPPDDLHARRHLRIRSYLYSLQEVAALMTAASPRRPALRALVVCVQRGAGGARKVADSVLDKIETGHARKEVRLLHLGCANFRKAQCRACAASQPNRAVAVEVASVNSAGGKRSIWMWMMPLTWISTAYGLDSWSPS